MASAKPLKTIVVATDFSADAGAALDWATAAAHERGARIVLVHAVAVAMPAAPEFVPLEEGYYEALRASAEHELARLAESVRGRGVAVDVELAVEPAVSSIVAAAARHHADVIVAGTRGLTGLKRLVLGSNAARLVRSATCPVVTVHGDDAARFRAVRTILVPTDLSDDALHAAEAAAQVLGDGPDRRIVLLHVYRFPMVLTSAPAFALTREIADFVRRTREELEGIAARFREQGIAVEVQIEEGLPSHSILEQAKKVDADMIAMGTHGRSGLDRLFLGSTAERVLPAAPCPVLTVHEAEKEQRA